MHSPVRMAAVLCLSSLSLAAQIARDTKTESSIVDSDSFLKTHLAQARPPKRTPAPEIEKLVARMTLKEKVGQMTQLEIGMVSDGIDQEIRINPAKLRKAVVEYGVGSLLNVKEEALPLERWHEILKQIQQAAAETRLKIPVLYGIDSIHGANYVKGATTMFPQPLGMAATWNPELMLKGSQIAAAQTRAAGIPWNFSPVLDVGRQPLWPRLYETFGEDPYLASVMAVATIRGYEGNDVSSPQHVAATMKHYVGYSFPLSGHDRTPAFIPESAMREYFLPSFAAGAKAGAHSVMVNSGDVNGIPGHINKYLLTNVLRDELGFQGMVVSDWEDIKKLVTIHRVAPDEKEATRKAVLAGIDMSMVPSDYSFADLLLALVQEGKVPMSRIDEAVRRVLTLKSELGLFQDPLRGISATPVSSTEAEQVALDAARESITLLKNSDILPLSKSAKVLVTGPTADSLIPLNNGWTYTWQGDRASTYPTNYPTILGAIKASLPPANVTHVPGVAIAKEIDISAAVAAARTSDVVVACLGEWSYTETPGSIDDLTLPEPQLRLVEQLASAGKPIVLILVEGRPRIIHRIVGLANAIVLALNPGNQGGRAVTDVLFGDINPSGRLPITYPPAPNALLTYDHNAYESSDQSFGLQAFHPEFAFGSGLSYTTFSYSDLKLSAAQLAPQGRAEVSVSVANTGQRPGKEVVQLYVGARYASLAPPGKRLKRFAKVQLAPGESKRVTFTLKSSDFAFFNADGKLVNEESDYDIFVGSLRQTLHVQAVRAQAAKR